MPPAVRIKRRDKSSTYQDGTGSCFCPEFGVLVRSSELDFSSNSEPELRTPGKNIILYQTATFMESVWTRIRSLHIERLNSGPCCLPFTHNSHTYLFIFMSFVFLSI